MKYVFCRLVLCRVFLLMAGIAGSFASHSQEYIFNHLTTKDGLASNNVYSVLRDVQGYLWVGTETGLQRYDGSGFIYPRFRSDDNTTYSHSVEQILEDRKGRLWLRMGTTVGIFDTHTFRFRSVPLHLTHPNAARDYVLCKNAEGNIYLVMLGATWMTFNEKKFSFEESETPFKIPSSFGVYFILDDKPSQLMWIGGKQGFMAYDKRKKKLYTSANNPDSLPLLNNHLTDHYVISMFIDSRRRYWIVNWHMNPGHVRQNLYCYDEKKKLLSDKTDNISPLFTKYFELNNIREFGDSNITIYGHGSLILNRKQDFESFNDTIRSIYNIIYNTVTDITEDKDSLLWIATDNGLYNTEAITKHNQHLILNTNKSRADIDCVLPFRAKDGSQEIWAGTWGGRGVITLGKTIYENSQTKLYDKDVMHSDYSSVWGLAQHSRDNKVWITCQHGLLQVFDPATGKSRYLKPAPFAGKTIRNVVEDKQGNLWFGTQSGSLVKWLYGSTTDDSSFHVVANTTGFIATLYVDNKGMLWVSSPVKGVIVFDPKTNQPVHQYMAGKGAGSLSDNDIAGILQVDDTTMAFAGQALNLLNTKTGLVKQSMPVNKSTGKIQSMQLDRFGQLWLSSTNGIYKYNLHTDNFKLYTQQDGLVDVSNEDYYLNASMKMDDGNLVFAGSQNLIVFNPAQYITNTPPANVTITGISTFNRNLPVDSLLKFKEIEFAHDQNSITFRFASLNFREVNKLTYYYKLEGADKDWIVADGFQATYSLLPPGSYTFKVRSQNEEGIYSNDTTELQIYIRPSFWQSIWFYLLLAAITAGFLYYLHRLRIQRILHVERVRTRLARDLHDDMGSTLSTINILSNMALQKAGKDEKTTKEFISRIGSNSSRMMEAMDDIVWSINPVNDSMQKVTARMKEFAGNALEAKDIDYAFHIDDEVKDLHFDMDARRSIFLIFKEAINNILKYAEATDVNIVMEIKKKEMRLLVEDNGKGFDSLKPTSTSRGNGVRNMQKRAEAMKGTLQLNSATGKGTILMLCVPIK